MDDRDPENFPDSAPYPAVYTYQKAPKVPDGTVMIL
jgi:hypothetical protein